MENKTLIKLVKLYYNLPKGYIIDNPNRLNFICKIFDICDVYISNRALKHIVESRKEKDLKKVEEIICLIKSVGEILINPEIVFINDKNLNSIGLVKKINNNESSNIIIILEFILKNHHYELATLFERQDKKIKNLINIKRLIK